MEGQLMGDFSHHHVFSARLEECHFTVIFICHCVFFREQVSNTKIPNFKIPISAEVFSDLCWSWEVAHLSLVHNAPPTIIATPQTEIESHFASTIGLFPARISSAPLSSVEVISRSSQSFPGRCAPWWSIWSIQLDYPEFQCLPTMASEVINKRHGVIPLSEKVNLTKPDSHRSILRRELMERRFFASTKSFTVAQLAHSGRELWTAVVPSPLPWTPSLHPPLLTNLESLNLVGMVLLDKSSFCLRFLSKGIFPKFSLNSEFSVIMSSTRAITPPKNMTHDHDTSKGHASSLGCFMFKSQSDFVRCWNQDFFECWSNLLYKT